VDVCPTKVLEIPSSTQVAQASHSEDCIGCCSCEYICPSRCLTVNDVPRQLPFYRIDQAANLVSRFLQQQPAREAISPEDVRWALDDVKVRLRALGDSVTETMGRGLKVVGRQSGVLAAEHLPDLYEETTLPAVLEHLNLRFAGAFSFTFDVGADGSVGFTFPDCALKSIAEKGEQGVGTDALCVLFHEYWAGLVGEFSKRKFAVEPITSEDPCSMKFIAK
jgi:ferredoxin